MHRLSDQIREASASFGDAPDERMRMGQISGGLWMVAAAIGVVGAFLPGAEHKPIGFVLALSIIVFLWGLGSVTGWIPWQQASIDSLGVGMVFTMPVVGLAVFLSGGAISYIAPLFVFGLLYAAFFFPPRWAWPLVIETILIAGAPLLYDGRAIDLGMLPWFVSLAAGYLAASWVMVGLKRRLVGAEVRQREFAYRDPLTGAANRRYFDAIMERELERRRRPLGRRDLDAGPMALLIIDLDDFKGVNDRLGHQAGDAVLAGAAARVMSVLRSADTLARIGGDEFAIIAPGARAEGAARLAESVRAAVSLGDAGDDMPAPSASVGWAVFPEDGRDFETLMRCADDRMLRSKRFDPRREASAAH